MQLTRVTSRMIYAAGYDEPCERMEIVFFNGIYRYYDVPKSVYEGLVEAESKGRYMHAHVLGQYPYRRLQREPTPDVEPVEQNEQGSDGSPEPEIEG